MPLISIIIPVYNVSPWLRSTLRSVQAQTFHDWECIIIDDGSTDEPASCIPDDPRFRLIRQDNAGVSAARNRGLDEARGALIAFLDGDDIWHPQALELLHTPFTRPDAPDFVWGDFLRFEDKSGAPRPSPLKAWNQTDIFWQNLLIANFLQFGALLFKKEKAAGLYFDRTLRICEDRDWLIRLLKSCRVQHVPHIVHYYRQRGGSAVGDTDRFLKDEAIFLERHIHDTTVSELVQRRARSAFLFHSAVLLAKLPGRKVDAAQAWLRAVLLDPLYTENYMQILRKALFKWRKPAPITEVQPYL